MVCARKLLVGFVAATALLSGSVAADTKADPRTNPAPPSSGYGVVEHVAPDPAQGEGPDAAVAGTSAAAGQGAGKSQSPSGRSVIRVRLDDGRYQGFHQHGGDELRVGDRVQIEIDRLHRASEQDQTKK
jgi:hypothetical protein